MSASSNSHLVWFITGTSQGFGRELVRAVLERGDSVLATSRKPQSVSAAFPKAAERLVAISMDLRNSADISFAVQQAVGRFGRIDVLVNNAGYGVTGAVEEASDAEIADVYDTNVFGLLRVTRAVLPQMRKQRRGQSSISLPSAVSRECPVGESTTPQNSRSKDYPKHWQRN